MRNYPAIQNAAIPNSGSATNADSTNDPAREKVFQLDRAGTTPKASQYRDLMAAAEAKANEQARVLQRQQLTKAHYEGQGSFPVTPVSIDRSAEARQRQFQ